LDTEGDKPRAWHGIISQVKKTGGGMIIENHLFSFFIGRSFRVGEKRGTNSIVFNGEREELDRWQKT
jgi:hypothetical protein